MNLALKDTKWENVRKRIRIAIEEEKRRKANIFIQGANSPFFDNGGQAEGTSENILVTVNASDSGLGCQEGAK